MKAIEYYLNESHVKYDNSVIDEPCKAGKIIQELIGNKIQEHVVILWLSNQSKVEGFDLASIGTINSAFMEPRTIFRAAILLNSNKIIIGHNHPSGNLEPSKEDIEITKKMISIGDLLDIQVLDHVIVTKEKDSYYSFTENGLL